MSYWGKDRKKKRQAGQVAQNGREVSKNDIYDGHSNQSVQSIKEKDPDINFNEDESSLTTFLIQTRALMWKNSLLIRRKSTFLPFLIMTPLVVGFLLDFIMVIGKVLTEQGVLNPKIELEHKLVACKEPFHFKYGDEPCLTVGYGIIGQHKEMDAPQYDRYHDLMKIYAKQNDFEYGQDIKALTVGNSMLMNDYLMNNLNKTQFAVMFCHEQWREELEYTDVELPSLTPGEKQNMTLKQIADLSVTKTQKFDWEMPCKFDHQEKDQKDMYAYYMVYNYTLGPDNLFTRPNRQMKYDDQLLILKTGIDNAILEQKAVANGLDYIPKIKQELQSYPYVPSRWLRDIDVVSMYGAFYLIMVPLTVFMLLLDELVREKVDHLRKGMQLLGTLDSAYWASWILTGAIMNTIISLGMIVVGRFIYQFEVFVKAPWYVWFGMFYMNTQAYISLACFLSTIVTSKMMAFSVNFTVILTSFVECMVLSEPMMMKKVFFNLDTPQYMKNFTKIFYLNPCFPTAKMFADITNAVSAHFDAESFNWIKSEKDFQWEDIWRIQEGKFVSEEKYLVPSIWDTGVTLVIVTVFYFFLTFYFDSILPDNRGVPQPWYFLISPFYWFPCCFSKSSQRNTANQNIERYLKELLGSNTNKTVSQELKRVSQEEKGQKDKYIDGLRAINLSKSYKSITGTSNVQALKNVTFDIQKGELLGIMGHNGAGKSTLINVLCGLVYKDQGIARTFGLNTDDNLTQMRKRMGVVSQFDVLWDELTGIEHMHLFQILKRVEIKDFDRLVKERLGEVGLKDAGTLMVGKYSGGMRRRISVALSTMGDPDIILMDEPTTGMDPVSRRHVWQLVQKMKMDKAIIMSTHAMEEAELLSDKIIVLDNGELKCVGTPFQLKNSLGKGYRISMICGQDDTSKVKKAVQKVLPSSIYQESSGDSGGLVFDLPFSKIKELGPIFGLMSQSAKDKQKSELAQMVTDVGVSQTSLEEVFMAVTGQLHQ